MGRVKLVYGWPPVLNQDIYIHTALFIKRLNISVSVLIIVISYVNIEKTLCFKFPYHFSQFSLLT